MAKLTIIVGDKTIYSGMVNSLKVYGDTASFKTDVDAVIEIDPEPSDG